MSESINVYILCERKDGYMVMTLNRAERRNALSSALLKALRCELDAVNGDSDVRAIVLTGSGAD